MQQAQNRISTSSSRLVRSLAELAGWDAALTPDQFGERLGQLFDLPDSIRLSAVHDARQEAPGQPQGLAREEVKADFLRVRDAIVSSVRARFTPGTGSLRLRFPLITADMSVEQIQSAEPYLAFYAAQQRDIDLRVRNLQASIREAVAGFSPDLARLAALDAALADPLAAHSRRLFAVVPRVLEQRFAVLLANYRRAIGDQIHDPEQWGKTLEQFRRDMRGLLLAEIEARLLPTLGLIEAMDEERDS
jgi:hypothetical protein